jgi:release factor glutamine methyltransferase
VSVRLTVGELLASLEARLASVPHSGHSPREARDLMSAVLDISPAAVVTERLRCVPSDLAERALHAAERRLGGEPLAYCVGTAAFRHLVLDVDARVLIPRPETEVVVGEALALTSASPGGIAVDIGTGSGAIALSLASEGSFDRVIATDVSCDALEVARANAARLPAGSAPVDFRQGGDLAPVHGIKARVMVSNPPYIAYSEASSLPASVRDWEPPLALFADDDGMARYKPLLAGAPDHLEPGGWLVLEVDARRARHTMALADACGRYASVRLVRDLTGRERVLVAQVSGKWTRDPGRIPGPEMKTRR